LSVNTRAPRSSDEPRLSVVVMSLDSEPGVVEAVRSIVEQGQESELVVVNSGGGDPSDRLRAAGFDVPVVNRTEHLMPGGARNLGIRSTRGRYVAFLAADCLAEPGWVAGRLRHHAAGVDAVATAITNPSPRSAASTAYHLLLYHTRRPEAPAEGRKLFGLSYDRRLFERFGLFPEDIRFGEDALFNALIADGQRVEWAPEVRTAHRHPRTVRALVRDLFGRGRVAISSTSSGGGSSDRLRAAGRAQRGVRYCLRSVWREPGELSRRRLVEVAPLILLAAAAQALGALLGARTSDGELTASP
jgi:glycosyltransferase involved in cell wall biosynthesis